MPGSGYNQIFYDPTQALNINDATPFTRFTPGEIVRFNGRSYLYVQHHQGTDVVVTAAGMPAYWRDRNAFVVTGDKTDNLYGAALSDGCVGIYQGVVTHLNGTFILFNGVSPTPAVVPLSGVGAIGNKIFPPAANTDNQFTTVARLSATAAQAAAQDVGTQLTLGTGGSNVAQVDFHLNIQN